MASRVLSLSRFPVTFRNSYDGAAVKARPYESISSVLPEFFDASSDCDVRASKYDAVSESALGNPKQKGLGKKRRE